MKIVPVGKSWNDLKQISLGGCERFVWFAAVFAPTPTLASHGWWAVGSQDRQQAPVLRDSHQDVPDFGSTNGHPILSFPPRADRMRNEDESKFLDGLEAWTAVKTTEME